MMTRTSTTTTSTTKVSSSLSFNNNSNTNNTNKSMIVESYRDRLMNAIRHGDIDAVKEILAGTTTSPALRIIDLNFRNFQGLTPLLAAVTYGHCTIVQLLLSYSDSSNNNSNNHRIRIDINAITPKTELTSFHIACQKGFVSIVELLIHHINPVTNHRDLHMNLQDCNGWTAFHHAVYHGRYQIAQLLIQHRVYRTIPNDKGSTPFHLACFQGYTNIVQLLIDSFVVSESLESTTNSNMNESSSSSSSSFTRLLNLQDHFGNTPLHVACRNCHYDIVQLLLLSPLSSSSSSSSSSQQEQSNNSSGNNDNNIQEQQQQHDQQDGTRIRSSSSSTSSSLSSSNNNPFIKLMIRNHYDKTPLDIVREMGEIGPKTLPIIQLLEQQYAIYRQQMYCWLYHTWLHRKTQQKQYNIKNKNNTNDFHHQVSDHLMKIQLRHQQQQRHQQLQQPKSVMPTVPLFGGGGTGNCITNSKKTKYNSDLRLILPSSRFTTPTRNRFQPSTSTIDERGEDESDDDDDDDDDDEEKKTIGNKNGTNTTDSRKKPKRTRMKSINDSIRKGAAFFFPTTNLTKV